MRTNICCVLSDNVFIILGPDEDEGKEASLDSDSATTYHRRARSRVCGVSLPAHLR